MPRTVLNGDSDDEHPFLVFDFNINTSNIAPLGMMSGFGSI